jgi:hypothetical protein
MGLKLRRKKQREANRASEFTSILIDQVMKNLILKSSFLEGSLEFCNLLQILLTFNSLLTYNPHDVKIQITRHKDISIY